MNHEKGEDRAEAMGTPTPKAATAVGIVDAVQRWRKQQQANPRTNRSEGGVARKGFVVVARLLRLLPQLVLRRRVVLVK